MCPLSSPPDFPQPLRCPSGFALGTSLGSQEISQASNEFPKISRVLVEYGHLIHHHSFPRECIGKSFPVDRVGLTVFYPILPVNDDRMHHPDFDPFPFPLSSHNFHFCNSSIHLVTVSYRFGFHGTLWFYSGISVVALLYGFFFMPDYSRYVASSYPRYVYS